MNNQQQYLFSIKCQCSAYKNGLLITLKKKSKLSNLVLNSQSKTVSIVPLNSREENIVFQLKKLKHIHRKFIAQGKITLQFSQDSQNITNSIGNKSELNKAQRLCQIFVEAASPQNLQLLIKKIVDIKKSLKSQSKSLPKRQSITQKQHMTKQTSEQQGIYAPKLSTIDKRKESYPKPQKYMQNIVQRKKDPLRYSQKLKQYERQYSPEIKLSRKQLMNQAKNNNKALDQQVQFPQRVYQQKNIFKSQVDILQLPNLLIQKIFQYTTIQLKHRLISKKFDKFALKNIKTLKFKDQVDDESFNKMAKYAPNLSGRLKNVRNIQLIDLYDEPQLQKDRAKSLYFGQWKQMSKKNILQIKGLRIHTLQMPYQIKFQFQNIYGIKLRQLDLYSKYQVLTPNYFVADQDIIYIFKHVRQIEAFSIPYLNSSVLEDLGSNHKQKIEKLKKLRIGSINENSKKQQTWFLFHIYQQLKQLSVERVLKGGLKRKDAKYKLTFPMYIEQLTLGSFLIQDSIRTLPTTLIKLKLSGQTYLNKDISNIFLPYLRIFDLTQCLLIRPSVIDSLGQCSNLKIITTWEKQDIDYWKEMAANKGIQVVSVRGMIKR